MKRRHFHRWVFLLAGIYNLTWGVFTALYPQWFFEFNELPPLNHPQVFACLGMVIGLYGVLYLEVARVPEQSWPIAAVGLTGKVLGPIGLIMAIARGEWPASTLLLCITNDFIWWIPFAVYLRDAWPSFRAQIRPQTFAHQD